MRPASGKLSYVYGEEEAISSEVAANRLIGVDLAARRQRLRIAADDAIGIGLCRGRHANAGLGPRRHGMRSEENHQQQPGGPSAEATIAPAISAIAR